MTPNTQKILSAGFVALGVGLLILMVTTEGEPGALPLGLVLVGAIGYATGWTRGRSPSDQ